MTTTNDTTRAASRHDGGALSGDAEDARLDEAVELLLQTPTNSETDRGQTLMLTAQEVDPTYCIGAQLGRLVALHHSLDRAGIQDDREIESRRHRRMGKLSDGAGLLREAMTYERATSLPGALAQLVVASQALSDIFEIDSVNQEERINRVMRCLFSVAHVISAETNLSPRVFGADYYMPQYIDHLGNAWSEAQASYVVPGQKPAIAADPISGAGSFVEQQLVAMNDRAGVLWQLYEEAVQMEDENRHNPSNDQARFARHKMGEMAGVHARRRWCELLRRTMALPATSQRELGLQARLVAVELNEWWDNDDLQAGELACRQLLDRLMTFAGIPRIERGDVEPAEIRDWLDRPEEHAPTYNFEMRRAGA